MLKLEICPFCGTEAELSKDEYGRFLVSCTSDTCGAAMLGFKNRQYVIDAWNTRVSKTMPKSPPDSENKHDKNEMDNDIPRFLSAYDLAKALHISKPKAYELMHQQDFPSLRLGRRLVVPKDKFSNWINRQIK
ncbi:MAG: helix-turn-helix domain-containing protein [Clostridia bacterium]|nr:helix-turn-helix domain-containing protein [Clostridia bacterium]